MRPLCKICGEKPCAINYHKAGEIFYRKKCDTCARGARPNKPRWAQSGYKKKNHCEKCGYSSPHQEVFRVFHIDGDLNNCRPSNLKTVCCNCSQILSKEGIIWRQGDLIADY